MGMAFFASGTHYVHCHFHMADIHYYFTEYFTLFWLFPHPLDLDHKVTMLFHPCGSVFGKCYMLCKPSLSPCWCSLSLYRILYFLAYFPTSTCWISAMK